MKYKTESIPLELQAVPQWVVWRYGSSRSESKPGKLPINARTLTNASTKAPETWSEYVEAVRALTSDDGQLEGLGFVFSADDPYAGIDLDNCRDPDTGVIEDWAQAVVDYFDSYTEVSPSGTGLKIFVIGQLSDTGRNRRANVELYDRGRYFTVTGRRLPGPGTHVSKVGDRLALFQAFITGADPVKRMKRSHWAPIGPNESASLTRNDKKVLGMMFRRRKDSWKIAELWNGAYQEHYTSQSEADLALCSYLAYWTRKDRRQMDRMFRNSGLMRPKWDELRGEFTYGQRTIQRAIETTTRVHRWKKSGKRKKKDNRGRRKHARSLQHRLKINRRKWAEKQTEKKPTWQTQEHHAYTHEEVKKLERML